MRRREHGDRGAAAVEFALVVPVLVLLLFGMIDYGLYFTNRLAVQQGAHAAARQAAIGQSSGGALSCGRDWSTTPNEEGQRLGCLIVDRTRPVVGTIYVKIKPPTDSWSKGKTLTICEMVKTDGLTGFVPMPGGGVVTAKSVVSIEQDRADPPTAGEETPPPGESWSWC